MAVAHVIRTVVPLCTPHIRADTVVEIDMVICATPGVYRPSAQAEAHVAGSATHLLEIGVRLALLESKCVCITAVLANRLQPLWGYGAGPAIR